MTRRMTGTMTGGHVVKCTNAGPRWPAGEREGLMPPGPPAVNHPSARPRGLRSPVRAPAFSDAFRQDFILLPNKLMKCGGDTSSRTRRGNRLRAGLLGEIAQPGPELQADSLNSRLRLISLPRFQL